jgi:hydroxyacylglutathione hydrolase
LFEGTAEQLWQSLQRLKALPTETRVYCAHEYSENNARFALSVEPDNKALQQKTAVIQQRRANNLATVPSTIGEELATNPFFREDSAVLQNNLHCVGESPVKIFTLLRQKKDTF